MRGVKRGLNPREVIRLKQALRVHERKGMEEMDGDELRRMRRHIKQINRASEVDGGVGLIRHMRRQGWDLLAAAGFINRVLDLGAGDDYEAVAAMAATIKGPRINYFGWDT